MIEINLCVLLGLSRGNQSWFNSVKGPISVGEETHCDVSFDCSALCPPLLLCLFHQGPLFPFICCICIDVDAETCSILVRCQSGFDVCTVYCSSTRVNVVMFHFCQV